MLASRSHAASTARIEAGGMAGGVVQRSVASCGKSGRGVQDGAGEGGGMGRGTFRARSVRRGLRGCPREGKSRGLVMCSRCVSV